MDWQIGLTVAVVIAALVLMIREVAAPEMVLMAAVIGLGLAGVLTPRAVFSGFANPVVAVVGADSETVRTFGGADLENTAGSGIDPLGKTHEHHLCDFVDDGTMHETFVKHLRSNGMGIDYSNIQYQFKDSRPIETNQRNGNNQKKKGEEKGEEKEKEGRREEDEKASPGEEGKSLL